MSATAPAVPLFCFFCPDEVYCEKHARCLNSGADLVAAEPVVPSSVYTPPLPSPEVEKSVSRQPASLHSVYDLLVAGKKLQLQFSSLSEALSFKSSLHRYKRRTADQLESLDIDFEKLQLNWAVSARSDGTTLVAISCRPKKQTQFTIVSIEDAAEDSEAPETQVPSSLGKD